MLRKCHDLITHIYLDHMMATISAFWHIYWSDDVSKNNFALLCLMEKYFAAVTAKSVLGNPNLKRAKSNKTLRTCRYGET